MREIKFRLMYRGIVAGYEWHRLVEGSINQMVVYHSNTPGKWLPVAMGGICHDRKDQYTGRMDINGKEIYDNDNIVRFKNKSWASHGQVRWDKAGSGFVFDPHSSGSKSRKFSASNILLDKMEFEGIGSQ